MEVDPTSLKYLAAYPGALTTLHLESKAQLDTSGFTFPIQNLSIAKMIDIELRIYFDFTNKNLTLNDRIKSNVNDPLIVRSPDLFPAMISVISLDLKANVAGIPTPVAAYPMVVSATFGLEAILPDTPDVPIGGGLQGFFVVRD